MRRETALNALALLEYPSAKRVVVRDRAFGDSLRERIAALPSVDVKSSDRAQAWYRYDTRIVCMYAGHGGTHDTVALSPTRMAFNDHRIMDLDTGLLRLISTRMPYPDREAVDTFLDLLKQEKLLER
ncbi:MAG: hypothetical protein JST22_13970 [Bacteroidetes bacterium]|nr:hypothetical protein [Bacteroidota bacterium]